MMNRCEPVAEEDGLGYILLMSLNEELLGRSTVKRRSAAKTAVSVGPSACEALVQALQIELTTEHWLTRVELIKSLGVLKCRNSLTVLQELVFSNVDNEFDLVKMQAAKALVRVSRDSLEDYTSVWQIIRSGGYSVTEGALEAVGYDRMAFSVEDCESLIKCCWDFGKDRPCGYTDPRYGLAAACAGWPKAIREEFLLHCVQSGDAPLRYVAENSLRGKFVKLR